MNVILEILGKDISSIIYNYLTINKQIIKTNHLKIIRYIDSVYQYFNMIGNEFFPSKIKDDQISFLRNCYWNNNENDWDVK